MERVTAIAAHSAAVPLWPGSHQPLGATWGEESTNFAVFAPEATSVELCLFDEVDGVDVERRHTLTEQTLGI
jgi:pullulanase/glycogen debranching enzyme